MNSLLTLVRVLNWKYQKYLHVSPNKFLKQRNQFNFLIVHISNEEVLDIINSLSNKATGPSSIPLKLLLLISDLIIIPLT